MTADRQEKPAEPEFVPLDRTPETQQAFDGLTDRAAGFEAMAGEIDRLQRAVQERVDEAEGIGRRLQEVASGESADLAAAREEGQQRADGQADEFARCGATQGHARRKLAGLADALRLVVRETMTDSANAEALSQHGRAAVKGSEETLERIREWLGARLRRWRPDMSKAAESPEFAEILAVLPDLNEDAEPLAIDADGSDGNERGPDA